MDVFLFDDGLLSVPIALLDLIVGKLWEVFKIICGEHKGL